MQEAKTQSSADCPQSTSDLALKMADLEKQLKEKEDRESKFKQLTLKSKKEATECKNKVKYVESTLFSKFHTEICLLTFVNRFIY